MSHETTSSGCRNARALLSLSLDDELNRFEQRRLERHLRDCGACRRFGSQIEVIVTTLRNAPLDQPSLSITWSPRRARRWSPGARVSVAASLIAISLGFFLFPGAPRQDPGSTRLQQGTTLPTPAVVDQIQLKFENPNF
ncbi:MAG: zf-HC2 domain-containing protein [Gaiellaceae bacterium]